MNTLLFFSFFLFSSHSILSAPGIRPWLFSHLGRFGFHGLYSLISVAAAGGFILSYVQMDAGAALYQPVPGARVATIGLMPLVIFLLVGRITTPAGSPEKPLPPTGIYRICRHPGSFALLLWAVLHLGNVTAARNVVVFVTMAAISGAALVKNEWILRRTGDNGHASYLRETSIFPFLAIAKGRQRLALRQIGWLRLIAALAVYGLILRLHPVIIGVDPLAPYR